MLIKTARLLTAHSKDGIWVYPGPWPRGFAASPLCRSVHPTNPYAAPQAAQRWGRRAPGRQVISLFTPSTQAFPMRSSSLRERETVGSSAGEPGPRSPAPLAGQQGWRDDAGPCILPFGHQHFNDALLIRETHSRQHLLQ